MRRILQDRGCEVIHLGHDRSVADVVSAAIQEDADGIAVSSYQGGHVEYFTYLRSSLNDAGAGHIAIYGGGGGVILADEIARLEPLDVRIYSPEDGQRLGLVGMIEDMLDSPKTDSSALLLARRFRRSANVAVHPYSASRAPADPANQASPMRSSAASAWTAPARFVSLCSRSIRRAHARGERCWEIESA